MEQEKEPEGILYAPGFFPQNTSKNVHTSDYAKGYNQAIKEVKDLCMEVNTLDVTLERLMRKFPRLAR